MRRAMIVAAALLLALSVMAPAADAGPLLDWWRSRPRLFGGRLAQPLTAFMPPATAYAPAVPFGQAPTSSVTAYSPQVGGCQVSCPVQTCQRVAVSYVPQTSYRTHWVQTPVTSYRPETTTDPCTGCQVTCVKPCTTYRWQLRRVPYTSYRPVYQTVTVQMPATSVGGCGTCGVSMSGMTTQTVTPTYGTMSGTAGMPLSNGNAMGQSILSGGSVPADLRPTMDPNGPYSSNRIVIPNGTVPPFNGNMNGSGSGNGSGNGNDNGNGNGNGDHANGMGNGDMGAMNNHSPQRLESPTSLPAGLSPISDPNPGSRLRSIPTAPPLGNSGDQTAGISLRHKWDYSPVKQASYQVPASQTEARAPRQPTDQTNRPIDRIQNQGWHSMRARP